MEFKKITVEGHRGYRPMENSLEGFEKAFKSGVDGIETDVWLSKDKFLFIYHGHTELGLCHLFDLETEKIEIKFAKDLTSDDLERYVDVSTKRKLPKLTELLDLAKEYPDSYLNFEFKDHSNDAMRAMGILLTEYDLKNKINFSSFNHQVKENQINTMREFPILKTISFGFCCHNLILLNDIKKNLSISIIKLTFRNANRIP